MTKLILEMYALLLANVACRRGAPLGGILAELGIDAADLQAEEAALREEMAGLWHQRKGVVAMKFAGALGAELVRLGPLGGEGAGQAQPAAIAAPPAMSEVRDAALPSYLQMPSSAIAEPAGHPEASRSPLLPRRPPSPLAETNKM